MIFPNTFSIKVSSRESDINHVIKIMTLKEKDIHINITLITWEFGRLRLTPTIMGLVSHKHKNPKHTRWIMQEEDDHIKNPKATI